MAFVLFLGPSVARCAHLQRGSKLTFEICSRRVVAITVVYVESLFLGEASQRCTGFPSAAGDEAVTRTSRRKGTLRVSRSDPARFFLTGGDRKETVEGNLARRSREDVVFVGVAARRA